MPTRCCFPWVPDAGDGTFRNPVLHADYSDPDVIRHGDDFFLTASSFCCTPGLPILHSRDLVNWTIINHAIQNVPHPRFREVQPGCGVWAPSLRLHGGKFWIFFPMPDEGIYVTTADHPAGRWSEPHLLQAAKGWIDPCPFWDDDGQAYLVHAYSKSRAGIRDKLHVRPMAPDGSRLLGEGQIVFDAPERHPVLEGPKAYKLNGWYYLLAPGGGVPAGWQVALRSRHIYGPYEDKIVLEQGSTKINGPHQGALVDLPNGEWWFVHFQDAGPYGRITHLQPVKWHDGWPLMGVDYDGNGVGEPVATCRKPGGIAAPSGVPQTSDEFDGPTLGLQWQWQANHEESWYSLAARPGWLRLLPQPAPPGGDLARAPHLLLQKFPARAFAVETALEFHPGRPGEAAGAVVVGGGAHASLALLRTSEGDQLVFQINGETYFRTGAPADGVRLRVIIDETARCTFAFAPPHAPLRTLEKTFQAREGGWIGAKIGLFALGDNGGASPGHADFSYFRFLPDKTPPENPA